MCPQQFQVSTNIINKHEIVNSLKVSHYSLVSSPVNHPWIWLEPSKNTSCIDNIRPSTNLWIYWPSNCRRISNLFHYLSIEIIFGTLGFRKVVSFNNSSITGCFAIHIKNFVYTINICPPKIILINRETYLWEFLYQEQRMLHPGLSSQKF